MEKKYNTDHVVFGNKLFLENSQSFENTCKSFN